MGAFVVMFISSELENDICYTTVGNLLTREGVGKRELPNSEISVISTSSEYSEAENDTRKRLKSKPSEHDDTDYKRYSSVHKVQESETSSRKRKVQAKTRGNNKQRDL